VIRRLVVVALAIASACYYSAAYSARADELAGRKGSAAREMRFEWHTELPAETCGKHCRRWISAVGPINDQTPDDFQAFAEKQGARGAILVLDSEGGSVAGAIALGRAIRRLEMSTTIGKTIVARSAERIISTKLSPDISCSSMCVFLLLAGSKRHVPSDARVFVHQIWLAEKRKRILTSRYTADEIALVERDIGRLARYTIEMGGNIELLEIALQVPAWGAMYRLTADEIQRVNLNTTGNVFDDELSPVAINRSSSPVPVVDAVRSQTSN